MIALLALLSGLPEVLWLGGWSPAGSAAAIGMGCGLFMDRTAHGALENPAYACVSGVRASVSGSMDYSREARTRTVYDSFGGVVGESEQAFNQGVGFSPGGFAAGIGGLNWGAAAGARAMGSFSYGYRRVNRDEAYVKVSEESLESRGLLWEFGASMGWSPLPGWTVGAGAGLVTGTRSVQWETLYSDPDAPPVTWEQNDTVKGFVIRGSGEAVVGRARVAAGVSIPMDWTMENDQGVQTELGDAMEVRLGALYLPGNRLRSLFSAELDWRMEDGPGLRNTWGVRAGVENRLPGGPIARFGFDYTTSPLHRALDTVTFTTGMGFVIQEWRFDAGLRLTPSRYRQQQLPGLPGFQEGDSLSIESLSSSLVFGLSRSFGEVPLWR